MCTDLIQTHSQCLSYGGLSYYRTETHLSVSRLAVGVVGAILGLALREGAIASRIAAGSRVLGGAVAAAAPVAGAPTCRVCA